MGLNAKIKQTSTRIIQNFMSQKLYALVNYTSFGYCSNLML